MTAERILFLGDSITDQGQYISFANGYFLLRNPENAPVLLNLGLSSETVCGLTEQNHPFPRPSVHDRLDRILAAAKPDRVSVCYGMNDGIFSDFSQERFEAYCKGMEKLVSRLKEQGLSVTLFSIPPFDRISAEKKGNHPIESGVFGFSAPFAGYDGVLCRYSEWVRQLALRENCGFGDFRAALLRYHETERQKNPNALFGDGVHPDLQGHLAMAHELLRALWGADPGNFAGPLQADQNRLFDLIYERDTLLHNQLKETVGHSVPWKAELLPEHELKKQVDALNQKIQQAIE